MPKTKCQILYAKKKPAENQMLKKLNMIYQVYQHTESHERYKKKKKNEGEK